MAGPVRDGPDAFVRARYVGNCLGELDRFLHVLMDATSSDHGAAHYPQERNSANRVARIIGSGGLPDADGRRLRALGRTRGCLRWCGGTVRRADVRGGTWMTVGWSGPDAGGLQRVPLGDRLRPAGAELAQVSLFYADLGERLGRLGGER